MTIVDVDTREMVKIMREKLMDRVNDLQKQMIDCNNSIEKTYLSLSDRMSYFVTKTELKELKESMKDFVRWPDIKEQY
jgi:predicted lipase